MSKKISGTSFADNEINEVMIDRRYFRYFDWISFGLTLALLGIGLLFVFSATYTPESYPSTFFKKQLFGALSGLAIYALCCASDVRKLVRFGFFAYFGVLCLLLYTMIGGMIGMGAKRWISLYFMKFQPAELAKLFLPVFVAYYFSEQDVPKYYSIPVIPFREFLFPLGVLGVSFVLILKQPDLGTALVILFSGLVLFWFVGLDRRFFIVMGVIGCLAAPLLWKCLKPYQQNRVLVLFGQGDIRKERYQIEQSKIAIGSGGVIGKGILQGTQNKLQFLPEDHTDFIFSVICEETGFIGALFILLLFGMLFARIIFVIINVKNFFDQIVAIGLLIHLLLSVCINIAMVTGMLPIVGIPLPLVSYGITNLWITLASLGWLNNIAIRRFYY
ncbi:MAG: FtsW/RodA/SpoVE family cell cycle protein [Candidatus Babeliales bacterium]